MNTKSFDLAWIVVNDLKQAIKFYTEVVGLKLDKLDEHYGWAELQGEAGGAKVGLAQKQSNGNEGIEPGQNAVMTFTVDHLEKAIAEMTKKGTQFVGEILEVPGHVKLQLAQDIDGTYFQLVECLE